MRKFFGKFLHGLATLIGTIFTVLINFMNILVMTFEGIRSLLALVFMVGCSTFIFLPTLLLFLPSKVWYAIFIILIIPILGPSFISLLRYGNYVLTEWMYDRANYLITGEKVGFENLSDYSEKYKIDQEKERQRQAEEEARRRQENMYTYFEDLFGNFTYYDARDFREGDFSGFGGNNQGYGGNFSGVNDLGFKERYEKATSKLGVPVNTDIYEVKLAYRKLAKKYHPDLNKEANAKEKFQEVNDAYEFLSEDNIKKYKNKYL
ncbi:DnaJ domain-containing protein [uncultured Anaerococcus sp.]|uniref:DnaJ domain-containing protein n=1 Tax=uncultured Anaerococcus sp. TaxID=293428 RepID=UPI0026105987|nr:DnaJ domain-containing protein [uncultured Anaerococcus sp.]